MAAKFTRKDFLEALFADYYKEHRGFILVKSLRRGDPKTSTRYFPNIEILAKEHYGDERDVYFGVCPRERMKAEKEHIHYLIALWADLDIGKEGHEDKKVFFEGPQKAARAIRSFPRAPSIIVESGRGAHLYWLLKQVEAITDHEKAEAILRNISQHLQCDTEIDLDTGLRLPETVNTKVPGKPVDCDVKFINTNFRYSLKDFQNLGERVEVATPGRVAEASRPAPPGRAAPAAGVATADDSLVLDETIMDELVDDMSMTNVVTDSIVAEVMQTTKEAGPVAPSSTNAKPERTPVVNPRRSRVPEVVTSSVLERLSVSRANVEILLLGSQKVIIGTIAWNEDGMIGVESGGELYTIPLSSVSYIKSETG